MTAWQRALALQYFFLGALLCTTIGTVAHGAEKEPLTPEAAIETTRIMQDYDAVQEGGSSVSISPHGRTFVLRLIRGDVASNSLIMTIKAGEMATKRDAVGVSTVAELRSTGLYPGRSIFGPASNTQSYHNRLAWLDDRTIAFLWPDTTSVSQVVSVSLRDGAVSFLTHQSTQVMNFAACGRNVLVYSAQSAHEKTDLTRLIHGFTVPQGSDFFSLMDGYVDGTSTFDVYWNSNWYAKPVTAFAAARFSIGGHDHDVFPYNSMRISPDCRFAVISAAGFEVPQTWSIYKGRYQTLLVDAVQKRNTSSARSVEQLFVVDLNTLTSKPLWNAPSNLSGVSWAADSRHVLVTSTYLPPAGDIGDAGLAGQAAAVVDTQTGQYEVLRTTSEHNEYFKAQWHSPTAFELRSQAADRGKVRLERFALRQHWERTEARDLTAADNQFSFEVHQDRNTPPQVFLQERKRGKATLVFESNPTLTRKYALGEVSFISKPLSRAAYWQATLYYPTSFRGPTGFHSGVRYPLVIQSEYGPEPDKVFTLYGFSESGTGPSLASVSVAQLLANRGYLVAEVSVHSCGGLLEWNREAARNLEAWQALIKELDSQGVVDVSRIGVSGFSRNGYYVEYGLTHSEFPFGAAIAADNYDPSYIYDGLAFNWDNQAAESNGAQPFGAGLEIWLKEAPGFNVDKIRTPLMLEAQSGGVTALSLYWEFLGRLRFLNFPVELWAVPDYEHADHNIQNPEQLLAVQHRVIDWFDFWLLGREDSTASKREQYQEWERLCALQRKAHPQLTTYCIE